MTMTVTVTRESIRHDSIRLMIGEQTRARSLEVGGLARLPPGEWSGDRDSKSSIESRDENETKSTSRETRERDPSEE
ncbi:unnamed protein product [Dovyalis caffra]|uniref:Uncharacterized protein n=1 Tax=Dovyalis caffra TaxID=77055 RepID=A0AAV1SII4_9ROSI|nr:unnamed protein product [Dovyalis caffra]